jgi:hypothetical protein
MTQPTCLVPRRSSQRWIAIDRLASLAAVPDLDPNVSKIAGLALEVAARKSHARAEEALRRLVWR